MLLIHILQYVRSPLNSLIGTLDEISGLGGDTIVAASLGKGFGASGGLLMLGTAILALAGLRRRGFRPAALSAVGPLP